MTKPGRNDPCPCGSGIKFKRCCGLPDNDLHATRIAGASAGLDIQAILQQARKFYNEGRLADASLMCHKVLSLTPNDPQTLRVLSVMWGAAKTSTERFQRTTDAASISALRHIRRELIALLLALPTDSLAMWWFSLIEHVHATVLNSGLRELIRDTNDESQFKVISEGLLSGQKDAKHHQLFLAGMLLGQNFELPLPDDLTNVPSWLRERFCTFLLKKPQVFNRIGDASTYEKYLSDVVNLFHLSCIDDRGIRDGSAAHQLIQCFITKTNSLQSYFNSNNLREVYKKRGDLISAGIVATGAVTLTAFKSRANNRTKIRLGILAAHFGVQTETYFTISHFEHLDRTRFEITLYALVSTGTTLEHHCITRADRFVVLPKNDLKAQVGRIRSDDLDLLLIGSNMTAFANQVALIGSHRLARIQIATVSSPVTTGLRHVDIMLSSEWNEPSEDAQQHYTERLWLMPGSINFYAYQYDTDQATINFQRSDLGISNEITVFFSGANYFKLIPELTLSWVKILAAVPNSILLLMPFGPNWSNAYQTLPLIGRIQDQMRQLNVDSNRLRIISPVPTRADVHKVLAIADIYLDAYPFAGACSLLDPIIVGVPPVVRSGAVGRSNHGASLMQMIGLSELISDSETTYIAAAIELALNPARRQKIRSFLTSLKSKDIPLYFDTHAFSTKVGDAFAEIYKQYTDRYSALELASLDSLCHELQALADSVVGLNFELNALTDIGIVEALIEPFFRACQDGRPNHMVDVGACFGSMAEPLLANGWSADLFEPDPAARAVLEKNIAKYGACCQIHSSAVSNRLNKEINFHISRTKGLSGLGLSPFGPNETIISVPCVRLADFYTEHGVTFVDFLKIDAEGYDFDVLDSHDFNTLRPRLILVEYGTHFPNQPLTTINQAIARMATANYGSIIFNYHDDGNFSKGVWNYRLTDIFINRPLPDLGRVVFGNILFYPSGDRDFLLALHTLLDACRERTVAWRAK